MRRTDLYAQQEPRYFFFFWSPDLFPGFADDVPSYTIIGDSRGGDSLIQRLRDRLDAHYTLLHTDHLFRVYDLQKRKAPRGFAQLDQAKGP
jgi:hypothetical protein